MLLMVKRSAPRRRPRKAKPGTKGLHPEETRLERAEGLVAEAAAAIEKAGGRVVGLYREPLGGHPTVVAVLPIEAVEPTPFQRDLSDAHHKRLADVINKTGRFLDSEWPSSIGGNAPSGSQIDRRIGRP
jgi:ParB family transcriptional regulator, chromosome partitioning protein